MATTPVLRIPKADHAPLRQLLEMSDDAAERLVQAINDTPRISSASEYGTRVAEAAEGDPATLRRVVRLLINLYQLRTDLGLPLAPFVDVLKRAMVVSDDPPLVPVSGDWEAITARLSLLLSLDASIGVVAKAVYLRNVFGTSLHHSGLATDMRPIYTDDPVQSPTASIIVHKLTLQYHSGNQVQEVGLELTSRDVVSLRRALERAEQKEASLRALLKSVGVAVIGEAADD